MLLFIGMHNDEIPEIPLSAIATLPSSTLRHLNAGMKIPYEWFCEKYVYGENFGLNSPIRKGEIPVTPCSNVPIEDILLRLTAGWKVCSIQAYCHLSGFQEKAIRAAVNKMVESKVLKNLGRLEGIHCHEAAGELFAVNYKHDTDPYYPGDFMDLHHQGYARLTEGSERDFIGSDNYRTTRKYIVDRHHVGACEACARVVHELNCRNWAIDEKGNKMNDPCFFAFPEHCLRGILGWYNPNPNKKSRAYKNSPKLYATRVPDAWIVGRGMSLRFEYLRSVPHIDDLEDRLHALPEYEQMFFVIEAPDHSMVNNPEIIQVIKKIDPLLYQKFFGIDLPVYHYQPAEIDFGKLFDGIFSNLKKYELTREQALKTSKDCADDLNEINIRELSLFYSQGIFYHWFRKATAYSHNIFDMDGNHRELLGT